MSLKIPDLDISRHNKIFDDLSKKAQKSSQSSAQQAQLNAFNSTQKAQQQQQILALRKRKIRLEQNDNLDNQHKTPRLSIEDNEAIFSKMHNLKTAGVLEQKARNMLQRLRPKNLEEENAANQTEEDELNTQDWSIQAVYQDQGNQSGDQGRGQNQDQTSYEKNKEKADKKPTLEEAIASALGEHNDEVNQYLLLNAALYQLNDQDTPELKEKIQHYFDRYFKKNGKKISATVNAIDEIKAYGGASKSKAVLFENAYYMLLAKVQTHAEMLDLLINSFGLEDFTKVTNLMNMAAIKHQQEILMPCLHRDTIHDVLRFMSKRSNILTMAESVKKSMNHMKRALHSFSSIKKHDQKTPFAEYQNKRKEPLDFNTPTYR